ncbi:7037_t:CDS:1 [Scutellospora calospora]|uniref:7037_t:CDS:1 n=1 Tax=Scutellospora calospora TaxID=85575 RepID=A0ACA9KDQ3_9GLOM|nr:7037_t:CDS:1 [Scutellospora calospora]
MDNNSLSSTLRIKDKLHRTRNPLVRKCNRCKRTKLHKYEKAQQCNFCDNITFSGNEVIDNWLVKTNNQKVFVEFIPYKQFSDITYIAKGGFSEIYKASCLNLKRKWNACKRNFTINDKSIVVLKHLNDSENINHDFLNEVCIVKIL